MAKKAKKKAAKKVLKKKPAKKAVKKAGKKVAKKAAKKTAKKKGKRTTLYSSKGKKLYAVRNADGSFKDIQTYKRAHSADIRQKSAAEAPEIASAGDAAMGSL